MRAVHLRPPAHPFSTIRIHTLESLPGTHFFLGHKEYYVFLIDLDHTVKLLQRGVLVALKRELSKESPPDHVSCLKPLILCVY